MKKVTINWDDGDVYYNGKYIQIRKLKQFILKTWPELVHDYVIHRRFDERKNEVVRLYAWDSIFERVDKKIGLRKVMAIILKEEK